MLEDKSSPSATTKDACFGQGDKTASALVEKYGPYDSKDAQTLSGIDISTTKYNFADGNSIDVSSMFSGSCRVTINYRGPAKEDQGHF